MKWYELITPLGFSVWVVVYGIAIFHEIDPLVKFLIVCMGSGIAVFGIFYVRRKESMEAKKLG